MRRELILFFLVISFISFRCGDNKGSFHNTYPNIILIMADDLGYGDVAVYGNPTIKTPNLDEMASSGVKFNRFYSAAPVCSPTRGSCLTGRHPYRYSMKWAGRYALPDQEITIAEYLKTKGYATGHFGKWHVGGLSKTINQSEFPGGPTPYAPPWKNGFDESFSTESMMPTYNPYYHVGGVFGTVDYRHVQSEVVEYGQQSKGFEWKDKYWTEDGKMVNELLAGDDSKIIMDRSLNFIQKQVDEKKPFFTVIWFHTPHTPVVAGSDHRALYKGMSMEEQHWYGSITAMDEQIGKLRGTLKTMGVTENTLIWFCSDNGPSYIHNYNSSGGLRGKKAELYEGGIRVPAILEWPEKLPAGQTTDYPTTTSDFLPTILSVLDIQAKEHLPLDGANILPVLFKRASSRYLFFQSPLPDRLKKSTSTEEEQFAVIEGEFKLISADNGVSYQLYNLKEDEKETIDISKDHKEIVDEMKKALDKWKQSCARSAEGLDYYKQGKE